MLYHKFVSMLTLLFLLMGWSAISLAQFTKNICSNPQYECWKVNAEDSWGSLFPQPDQRMLVKKINRMNTPLHEGMIIAVPRNLHTARLMDLAPLPQRVMPIGTNLIQVDLSQLAWGAYDLEGNLINWGPISGGKSYCPDTGRSCRTITGIFTVYSKQGPGCISSAYPLPHGGAPMPYCMHFKGGYAIHGSATVPGHHASHGCVRLFFEDAMWLNREFVQTGFTKVRVVS